MVRPEKVDDVLAALMDAGFPAVTKMDVYGRGKQRGMKVGEVTYDEIPKEMILTVVKDADKDFVVKIVMQAARTGDKGAYGDGKIFVSPWTKSTRSVPASRKAPPASGRGEAMKEVMAVIRMNKMNETKQALAEAGISSFTARDVVGRGKGKVDYLLLKGAEEGYEEAIAQLGPSQADPQTDASSSWSRTSWCPDGADDHRGEPNRQLRRRQDLRHARRRAVRVRTGESGNRHWMKSDNL